MKLRKVVLIPVLIVLLQIQAMAALPAVERYDELVTAIRQVRHESRLRIERAVQQEKVREGWGRDRLREEIRRRRLAQTLIEQKESGAAILTASPGKPGTYRVVKAYYGNQPNQLVLDLGFSNYYKPEGEFPFQAGDVIARTTEGRTKQSQTEIASPLARNDERATLTLVKDASEADLFTYSASVVKVIDGDTFTAAVELGFGITTVQTLRLRALDAPEIESAEGREAKEFLERQMPLGSEILIRTRQSDKYDRYLADVFVNGEYVNQKLVEQGLAVALSNET